MMSVTLLSVVGGWQYDECYIVISGSFSWTEAKFQCEGETDEKLAKIDTEEKRLNVGNRMETLEG